MSIAYRRRKKSIRNEKRRLGVDGLDNGRIPADEFAWLRDDWKNLERIRRETAVEKGRRDRTTLV